jgi:hypothetical protein
MKIKPQLRARCGLVVATLALLLGVAFQQQGMAATAMGTAGGDPKEGGDGSVGTRVETVNAGAARFTRTVDLAAQIKFESSQQGADGVLRSSMFEEEMLRQGQSVWTRRKFLLPTEDAHSKAKTHKHLNAIEAVRWVSKVETETSLQLLIRADRALVSIPKVEFANVGFDGSWARAYYLIDPSELAHYQEVHRSARLMPTAGIGREGRVAWFERRSKAMLERVLWDFEVGIPLLIESESMDGRRKFRASVTVQKAPSKAPSWINSAQFEQRRYSDYLD